MCHGCSFSSTIVVALGVYIRSIQNIMSSFDPSGIGAGTDRVLSYFFFPGRDRDLERDLSEASFCNYLLSPFFSLQTFSLLVYIPFLSCSTPK